MLTLYSGPEGMSHKGLQNLWQPDTHFLNAKGYTLMTSALEGDVWVANGALMSS